MRRTIRLTGVRPTTPHRPGQLGDIDRAAFGLAVVDAFQDRPMVLVRGPLDTGTAPRRAAIGSELVDLATRHGLVSFQILGHLIRMQARSGLTDFLTVLVAQVNLLETQDALAATEGEVAIQLIALYKALGGGWEIAPPVP